MEMGRKKKSPALSEVYSERLATTGASKPGSGLLQHTVKAKKICPKKKLTAAFERCFFPLLKVQSRLMLTAADFCVSTTFSLVEEQLKKKKKSFKMHTVFLLDKTPAAVGEQHFFL